MQLLEIAILAIMACGIASIATPNQKSLNVVSYAIIAFLGVAGYLLFQSQGGSFVFGSFDREIGIEHALDDISFIIALAVCICGMYTVACFLFYEEYTIRSKYMLAFISTACVAALVVSITRDIFNFYVFFELLNICICLTFANTASNKNKRNTLDYLLIGGVAAVFIVIAIEIIYIVYGSLNVSVIVEHGKVLNANELILLKIATVFIVLASFLKLGVFPFAAWVRKIYTTCPNRFLTFYGTVTSTISIYLVIFFFYRIFHSYDIIQFASRIITPFCLAGIVIFSFASIKEKDLRAIMGYSTLAQVGYIYICMTTTNINTLTGGTLHIMHNVLVKLGLFAVICVVYDKHKSHIITAMAGMGKSIVLGICFCILAASLVGFPGTSGFVSKFYMFQGLVEERRFISVGVFVLGTILNVVYMWRIISLMYFSESIKHEKTKEEYYTAQFPIVAILVITVLVVLFGFATNFTLAKSRNIATTFLTTL